jgi:apolipoprotein N-acyltransferase
MRTETLRKRRRARHEPKAGESPPPRGIGPAAIDFYRSTLGQALTGSLLLAAALPPWDLWPLAWIAPVWWVLLIRRRELPGRLPYRSLWLAGFVFWLLAYHWLRLPHWSTSFGWIALAFYLSFYLPVFVGLSRVAVHRLRVPVIVAAPVVWTGLELARAHLLGGISMASLGHTQYRWLAMIQVSDLAGDFAVSFLVMFAAACLARWIPREGCRRADWVLAPLVLVLAAALLYGYGRLNHATPPPQLRVALIQGSIDVTLDGDPTRCERTWRDYLRLSRGAIREAARKQVPLDLIVWPETMLPARLVTYEPGARVPAGWRCSPEEFRQGLPEGAAESRWQVGHVAAVLRTPMIVGLDREHFARSRVEFFNSAAYLSASGDILATYDKGHLVTFGEYVPWADRFAWLQRLTPLPGGGLTAGHGAAAFEVRGLRLAPHICYESVLSHLIRGQVHELAGQGRELDVLVNLTNDGWFWGSSELDMHLICGVFRAVECRKPFLIAANTGFSAWIDSDGRIRAQGRRRGEDIIFAEVGRESRKSWYLIHGDWPAGFCLAFCVLAAAIGVLDRWGGKAKRQLGRDRDIAKC